MLIFLLGVILSILGSNATVLAESTVSPSNGLDFGDLPDTYGTSLDQDGAFHKIVPGFHLGKNITSEFDGQPHIRANQDKYDDGLILPAIFPGAITTFDVQVTNLASNQLGYVSMWIDLGDGKGLVPLILDEMVYDGLNMIAVQIPQQATEFKQEIGFLRVRLSYEPGLSYKGYASSGEVEDYVFLSGEKARLFATDAP